MGIDELLKKQKECLITLKHNTTKKEAIEFLKTIVLTIDKLEKIECNSDAIADQEETLILVCGLISNL